MVHSPVPFVSRTAAAAGLAALALLAAAGGTDLRAQTARVSAEENFRAAPNDAILGVLSPGTRLGVHARRDGWVQAELEGWMWIRSLQVIDRDGFDLVVHPEDPSATTENLRAGPRGPVLARLERGALLEERERIPGWVRVRRRGWVWAGSLEIAAPDPVERDAVSEAPGAVAAGEPSTAALLRTGSRGLAVLVAPGGDTLARVGADTDVEVLGRRGGWARVRVDGWAWMPEPPADSLAGAAGDSAVAREPTSPLDVAARPDAWRGRLVTWELQFISLERAEAVRTDFFEGEPFLLARGVGGADQVFVYVALPPERLADGERLRPLERITVVGRVREGASDLTGSPILDLVELRRNAERRDGG